MARAVSRIPWLLLGVVLLVLPVLPLPRWTQAQDTGPGWAPYLEAWLIGLVTIVVIAVLGGRILRDVHWRRPSWGERSEWWLVGTLAVGSTLGAAFIAHHALAVNPQLIDEVAQLFQARVFLDARLAAPAPAPAEAFLFAHTWITPAGWVQQFPPAHAVWLAIGLAVDLAWLVNPLFGGVSTVLLYVLARGWYGRRTGVIAAALWAVAGWVLFMSATYMNHVSTVAFGLATWVLVWSTRREILSPRRALTAGLMLAIVAATRPLDAVAVAMPVVAWLATRRAWRTAGLMAVGGMPILVGLAAVNAFLYGDPLTFGYNLLYGSQHNLGFHEDAYGVSYTPLIALSNMAVAVRRLHIYLFEWPLPGALLLGVWAVVARHRHPSDRWLALAILGAPVIYFFYWHSGFYPGPRFYYVAAPGLIIGTARAGLWMWRRARHWPHTWLRWDAALAVAMGVTLLWSAGSLLPARIAEYRSDRPSLKVHPERELAARGVERALVLVPESWGARVIVALWAAGIEPGTVERAYRVLDTCDLHGLVLNARTRGLSTSAVAARLAGLMDASTTAVPPVRDWPDPTVRITPGRELPPSCERELRRDLEGFHLYGPLAWRNDVGLDDGVIFARDLFDRNEDLLRRYAGWPVWRYAPAPGAPNGPPVLTLVRPGTASGAGR